MPPDSICDSIQSDLFVIIINTEKELKFTTRINNMTDSFFLLNLFYSNLYWIRMVETLTAHPFHISEM